MKLSKCLCAVTLIVSVTACQSPAKSGGASGSSSSSAPSSASADPSLPPPTPLKRVAEISYQGGFALRSDLSVPKVAVYSDGTVVFDGAKRLTLTPGALDMLVSTVQQDLKGQPTGKVLLSQGGHVNPDEGSTGVGVYQPGGTYEIVYAQGLAADTESQYPAGVGDAFAKLQALTSDATTPYTTTSVRYAVTCPTGGTGPERPWPSGVPQPGTGQQPNCLELKSADGATADAVRAACSDTGTPAGQPQPAMTVYRSDKGPRICRWRYALPDETP